ncbi:MAG: hypothetical protein OXP07_04460 [Defluviicoccus sp.]|nr:hypothetical protein [Defluviicoccus sp.]
MSESAKRLQSGRVLASRVENPAFRRGPENGAGWGTSTSSGMRLAMLASAKRPAPSLAPEMLAASVVALRWSRRLMKPSSTIAQYAQVNTNPMSCFSVASIRPSVKEWLVARVKPIAVAAKTMVSPPEG